MAIAFDAAVDGGLVTATSLTWSHTCTGSNLALVVGTLGDLTSDLITGVTYNAVAMTKLGVIKIPADRFMTLWGLINPSTGAHNIVATASSSSVIGGVSASYTGVTSFETPATTNTAASPATTVTGTFTTTNANDWTFCVGGDDNGITPAAGTGTTSRVSSATSDIGLFDSNAALAAGSHTLITNGGAANWGIVMAAMVPSGGAAAVQQMLMMLGVGS